MSIELNDTDENAVHFHLHEVARTIDTKRIYLAQNLHHKKLHTKMIEDVIEKLKYAMDNWIHVHNILFPMHCPSNDKKTINIEHK